MKKSELRQLIEEAIQDIASSSDQEKHQDFQLLLEKLIEFQSENQRRISILKQVQSLDSESSQKALMDLASDSSFVYLLVRLILTKYAEPEKVVDFINRSSDLLSKSKLLKRLHQKHRTPKTS